MGLGLFVGDGIEGCRGRRKGGRVRGRKSLRVARSSRWRHLMMSTISIFLRSSKVTGKSMVRASRLVARDKAATRRLHSVHACPIRRRPSADDALPHCFGPGYGTLCTSVGMYDLLYRRDACYCCIYIYRLCLLSLQETLLLPPTTKRWTMHV